jgi:hypothetical protein
MNSCYLCHLHSYVFSLFSDSAASFCICFICFGESIRCLKIAGVDRWRFQVFYGASIVLEVFLGQTGQTVR